MSTFFRAHPWNDTLTKHNIKIIIYLGIFRRHRSPKDDFEMLLKLQEAGFIIQGILIPKNDKAIDLMVNYWPIIEIPDFLNQKKNEIILSFERNKVEVDAFKNKLQSLQAQVGFIFYGNYFPTDFTEVCDHGFINYHPAPLPYIKGFECDSFTILEGIKSTYATLHEVTDEYDAGTILAYTDEIKLNPYSTPEDILHQLDKSFPNTLYTAIQNKIKNQNLESEPSHHDLFANYHSLKKESIIDCEKETLAQIWRKFRTFFGQHINIPLKIMKENVQFIVEDLILYSRSHQKTHFVLPPKYFQFTSIACKNGIILVKISSINNNPKFMHILDGSSFKERDLINIQSDWYYK